jgi:type I restriction enzyme S subunit
VIPNNFNIGDYYITADKFSQMLRYKVYPGDILVSVMGTVGRVAVVPKDVEPGIINPRLVRYRPDFSRVLSRYLRLTMQAPSSRDQLLEGAKGTTMEGLNMSILSRLQLTVPPLKEQDDILGFVDSETETLNTAITRTEREISLMQEYRTRLTADIVTGKLDVHKAAAKLPDPPVETDQAPLVDEEVEESETEEI